MMNEVSEWLVRDKASEIAKEMSDPLSREDMLAERIIAPRRLSDSKIRAGHGDYMMVFDLFGAEAARTDMRIGLHLAHVTQVHDDNVQAGFAFADGVPMVIGTQVPVARILTGMADGWSLSEVSRELHIDKGKVAQLLQAIATYLDKPLHRVEKERPPIDWVRQLEELGTTRPETADLSALVDKIFDLMSDQRFDELDQAFQDLDVKKVSADALVTLLRLSFSGRARISSWVSFLEQSRAELQRRGIDAQLELVGLTG